MLAAEREFGRPEGSTLLMAALESCRGVLNALEICESSERLIGIALSGGDYTKDLQTSITGTGVELMGARQHMIMGGPGGRSAVLGYGVHQPGNRYTYSLTENLWSTPDRSALSMKSSPPRRKTLSLPRRWSGRSTTRRQRESACSPWTER